MAWIRNGSARAFPKGFFWGTLTAGSAEIIDEPGLRYREEIRAMKDLGATAYRFAIAWPRVFPDSCGQPNQQGLDHYRRLIDELLAHGIEPFVTLYHWELPQSLCDRGGWDTRDTPHAFGDYAGYIARQLGDRVRYFFTINELHPMVEQVLALSPARFNQVRHHAALGHGLAAQAIHAFGRRGTKVGPAENLETIIPIIDTHENVRAAELAMREQNAGCFTVMMEGRYTDAFLAKTGADAPRFSDEDMRIIGSPIDFVGVNICLAAQYARAIPIEPGYQLIPVSASHPRTPQQRISPESLYWGPRLLKSVWNVQEIYITDSGSTVSSPDRSSETDRVMFLRSYVSQLQRATSDDMPVRGYFARNEV